MEAACRWAGKRPEKERYAALAIPKAHQTLATFRSAINSAPGSEGPELDLWHDYFTR